MKIFVFTLLATVGIAHAEVSVEVLFKPLPPGFQSQEGIIRSHIVTATQDWTGRFQTRRCTLIVQFGVRDWAARGSGRSFVAAPLGKMHDGKHLSEEGAAHKIRTGNDVNGKDPDIEIYLDPAYLRSLWFDPEPKTRTATVPRLKIDAYTVILHELGHALGFNGFRNQKDGTLPAEFMSAYDRWVIFDGSSFFFTGPNARKAYGQPLPLAHTNNNYHHVAEKDKTIDPTLTNDLMNGISFMPGRRYHISPLNIAMLSDCGLKPKK